MVLRISNLSTILILSIVIFSTMVDGMLKAEAQGIGVYPTNFDFQDAARGGEYFRTVGVVNSGASEGVFTFQGEGPIAEWVSFVAVVDRSQDIEQLTVPGSSDSQVLLKVSIPPDAANGQYSGTAKIVGRSSGQVQAGGASVGVGAALDISVTVTGEQKFAGSLVDSSVSDVEAGAPLRVRAVVRNSGNVRFMPQVTLEVIGADNTQVAQETFNQETAVFPNEAGELVNEASVSTQDFPEGEYIARVSAKAGEIDLGVRETAFSILPMGTLTRQGELRNLELVSAPRPGELGKLGIVFLNTGEIDTLAKFLGELYQQDRLIDVLATEEVLVPVGEQKTIDLFFRVAEPGEYRITGKVNYQGKETETKELAVSVVDEVAVSSEESDAESSTLTSSSGTVATESTDGSTNSTTPSSESDTGNQTTMPESGGGNSGVGFQESIFSSPMGLAVIGLSLALVILLAVLFGRKLAQR